MSKVSRSVLKSLVKECLVEILSEGLVGSNDRIQESKKVLPKKKPIPRKNKNTQKKEVIPETIKGMTSDPLMQSILPILLETLFKSKFPRRETLVLWQIH